MMRRLGRTTFGIAMLFIILLAGCDSVKKDASLEFDYSRDPIVVFNPDWTILPLPTNLMNPTFRQQIEVNVPKMEARNFPDYCTADGSEVLACMDLRAVIKQEDIDSGKYDSYMFTSIAAYEDIEKMGYDIEPDSDLTLYMKTTLNRLDGYYPGFIPDIPLSRKLDLNSVKPYGSGENDFAAEEANFFFIDITDKDNPVTISSADYQLIFDLESRDAFPYRLTIRNNPDVDNNMYMPLPFESGHIYLVVLTGVNDKGIKDTDGTSFIADSPFLLLASETPYIAPDGSSRNNLFTDLAYVQEIEEARQTTDYGLKIWQSIVGDKRKRGEVVAAYSFSISSTPESVYMDPQQIVLSTNPLLPEGAIGKKYDKDGELANTCTKVGKDFKPSFTLSSEIDTETVSTDNVKLYKKLEDGSYENVGISVSAENTDGKAVITLTPESELDTKLTYLVVANNSIKNKNENITNADVYSSLVKSEFPIINDSQWNSPFLDSRPDIYVSLNGLPDTLVDKEALADDPTTLTTEHLVSILTLIDAIREDYKPDVEFILTTDLANKREDILMMYTFNPGGCSAAIDPNEIDLVDADVTGDFDIVSTFSNELLPEDLVMNMLGEFVQTGVILDGTAVLSGTLYETDTKENGFDLDSVNVNDDGTFTLMIADYPISKDLSELLSEDTTANITMNGTIYNSVRIEGDVVSVIKKVSFLTDVTVEGVFTAFKRTETEEAGNE